MEILCDKELSYIDKAKGIINTDWYLDANNKNISYKMEVSILGDMVSPEFLNVKIFAKNKKMHQDPAMERLWEHKILERARELYQETLQ